MRRILGHIVVMCYLSVVASALLFTLQRITLPIPRTLLLFSYATMAPYQGYTRENDELIAEGRLEGGSIIPINLKPYYPLGHGWESVRMRLRSFRVSDDDDPGGREALRVKYRELAFLLLERERIRGRSFQSVRLLWEEWPLSPRGYTSLRFPPFTEVTEITQVP